MGLPIGRLALIQKNPGTELEISDRHLCIRVTGNPEAVVVATKIVRQSRNDLKLINYNLSPLAVAIEHRLGDVVTQSLDALGNRKTYCFPYYPIFFHLWTNSWP
jgi:hypothetical protein